MNKLILSLAALAVAGAASAAGPRGGHSGAEHEGPTVSPFGLIRQLDLSAEQRAQLRDIFESRRGEFESQRAALREQVNRLVRLEAATLEYRAQADAFADRAAMLARARIGAMATLGREMSGVLSPEQRQRRAALVQQFENAEPAGRQARLRGHAERRFEALADEIALSTEQRAQVRERLQAFREAALPSRDEARQQLRALVELDPQAPGYEARMQLAAERAAEQAHARARQLVDLQGELAEVLTPVQRQALIEHLQRGPQGAGRRHRPWRAAPAAELS